MIGIYKITNPKGRIYIGQSINIESRIKGYSKGNNFVKQRRLYNSIIKYGFSNHLFEVLEECNEDELNIRERFYQDLYDVTSKNGLNCRLTATTDLSGKMSLESIKKRSDTRKSKKIKITEEAREKMRIARLGRRIKGKTVIDINTNNIYNSIREAADTLGYNRQRLTNMLTGVESNKSSIRYYTAQ